MVPRADGAEIIQTPYSGPSPQDLDHIPVDLKTLRQWVLWRGADRIDRQTGEVRLNKIPVNPETLRNADSTDPTTWGSFEQCVAALPTALEEWQEESPSLSRGGGLGFVFSGEDDLVGVDLDHCRSPGTNIIVDWAQEYVTQLDSYAEASPTGTGVHILLRGTLPPRGRKKDAVEVYSFARFFTMTGWQITGTPSAVEPRQEALTAFHASVFGPQESTHQDSLSTPKPGTLLPEDDVLLAKAHAAKNGPRFSSLWSGDITGYDSPSNADLALCVRLAFWTQDAAQLDRLFRQSGLMRGKWIEKRGAQTYGERTVAEALARQAEHYLAPPSDLNSLNSLNSHTTIEREPDLHTEPAWPQCSPEAFYGLAGDIVRTIAPHTESDPVAILGQLLVMVGNAIGRTPFFPVEADRHYPNLFVCLVGATSKGRKGTSAGYPRRLLGEIDPAWKLRIKGGLSSGEGVIWNVRDATYGSNKQGQEVYLDEGESDKRLCILESEFARALAKTNQDGNVLSAVLRQAWDTGDLNTLVSGRTRAPVTATGAHVSVIAHITANELRRTLAEVEAANGFGNRFLWLCVQRSKLLPDGGDYPDKVLEPLKQRLAQGILAARTIAQMTRSADARLLWHRIYTELAEGAPGLVGALTARAEAQVLRLSMLYALCDQSTTIEESHLEAAYALWRYSEASARYVFGEALGDPLADNILQMLRYAGSEGLTRTDISNELGRHVKSATVGQALALLTREGFASPTTEKTSGRPIQRWFSSTFSARPSEKSEISEIRSINRVGNPPLSNLNSLNSLNSHTHEREVFEV